MVTSNEKVVKNAAWIIGVRIVQSILALVISMLTARYLGPSNYGLISYASSVVAFVVPIMQLGLPNILVQEIVNNPKREGEVLGTSIVLSVISSFVCMFGVATFANVVNVGETTTIIVCILYSLLLLAQAIEIVHYWFQAKLASKYVSITSLIAYVIVSAYKIFLLVTEKSIYWFAVSNALDYAIIGVALLIIYRRLSDSRLRFSSVLAKSMLAKSRYYIVSNMMITIFAQTDRIMLKLMIDDAAAGYYSAAVSCAGITSFVFSAIIDSMRPLIFESKKEDDVVFEKNVSRLYCVVIYLSLVQSILMTLFAPLIINILYGSAYQNTIGILQVLVWYTTFSYMGAIRNIWILAENKQKYLWIINLSGAATNVLLNAVLIPIIGGVGAAVASLITQVFTNVVIGFMIKSILHNNKLMLRGCNPLLLKDMWRAILAKRKESTYM